MSEHTQQSIRVLSWNVFNENSDAARIAKALAAFDPDIAVLQEALPAHIDAIKAHFAHVSVARDYALKGALCYLVIASHLPTQNETIKIHSETSKAAPTLWAHHAGWIEFLDSVSVDLALPDGPVLRVVNIHTSAGVSPSVRQTEITQTESHFAHAGPCIVAGDFNSYAQPWLAPLLAVPLGYSGKDWMISERSALNSYFAQKGFEPSVRGITFPKFRLQMDQVFVRGITVNKAAIDARLWGSDHRPIVVEISRQLRGQASL